MRKPLAALLSLLITLSVLPVASASAEPAEGPALRELYSAPVSSDGRTSLDAVVESEAGAAKAVMRLRSEGQDEPYLTFEDLTLSGGTRQYGTWRASPVQLRQGRTYVDVELTDVSGARTSIPSAGFVDFPVTRFELSQPVSPADGTAKAFGAKVNVLHTIGVSRVTAQLYKYLSNEKVGGEVAMSADKTTDMGGGYTSTHFVSADNAFDPAPGYYEYVVTARDDKGDAVSRRSLKIHRGIATSLTDLKATPDWFDADHQRPTVTITGRLVDADGHPRAGHKITAEGTDASTTTAEDGTFSIETTTDTGRIDVTAATSGDYLTTTAQVRLTARDIATRVSARASVTNARIGDPVTVSGTLERQTATGWAPLAGQKVRLIFQGMGGACTQPWAYPVTDEQGRYSLTSTVGCEGDWQVDFEGARFYSPSGNRVRVHAAYGTAVTDVKASPSPAPFGGRFSLTGRVARVNVPVGLAQVSGGDVHLWFSRDGKKWSSVSTAKTGRDGRFTFTPNASYDGYWRVDYAGTYANMPSYNPDRPSSSRPVFVDVRYRTAISSFNASPEPVTRGRTLTVKGKITKFTGTWRPGAGAAVVIYFQAKGSKTWKAVATVKADRNGWFAKGFKASADGTWMASYAGSAAYLGSKSAGDYVDVR
ncbi:carboxypeptidase-like regulatory domain-containing protein [Actinomadura rupiterrae]|uniref:carboxypeptidase-like regulatory domain-containing protein n=1 Tax=Actinomadura rupiterrae TaxID=559627 RepID=UPI0020A3107F|nr:carboxypeptidase-like regulatory domain-containing protein [Actinomadura rupiterrae]MCP2338022.1 hypothetical protein [Actinomadura rupiterrae]